MAIEKLKIHKLPGTDQIPAELIKSGGRTIRCEIHKLHNFMWKVFWGLCLFIGRVTDGQTDCSNYTGVSLLSTSYQISSNILLSRLTPYAEEIIGDHQCGFRCNRSTVIIDSIVNLSNTWEKWEYNEAVHQPFIDVKKTYDSVRREVLYNILIEFGIPNKKLVRLIKMCLNETYSRVRVGRHLSQTLHIKKGDSLSPLLFNFDLE